MPIRSFLVLWLAGVFSLTAAAQCPPASDPGRHVVQKEENLFRISQRYGVSMDQLAAWNNMERDAPLRLCRELIVSAPSFASKGMEPSFYGNSPTTSFGAFPATTTSPQSGKWHTVRSGETVAGLARLYGYTEERFREFNDLRSWEVPRIGSALRSSECSCDDEMAPATLSPTLASRGVVSPFGATATNPVTTTNSSSLLAVDERAMVDEINLMRSDPNGYASIVYYNQAGENYSREKVEELIRRLRTTPRLSTLSVNSCLYRTAQSHGDYMRRIGGLSHYGADGRDAAYRVRTNCPQVQGGTTYRPDGWIVGNENLVAGRTSARKALMDLLVDDLADDNGHRETLLAPEWRYVAIYNAGNFGGMSNNYVQLFGR